MPQFMASLFDRLSEADLQHACGPQVFAQADLLERTGHVVKKGYEEGFLVGQVRGAWRRVEDVKVGEQAARLAPECTCGKTGVCRHVGALLLRWVRHRGTFATETVSLGVPASAPRSSSQAMEHMGGLLSAQIASPEQEFAILLEGLTVARLREIAQKRKISHSKSRGKAEMITLLASALVAPDSISAALAQLDSDELLALDVLSLVGPEAVFGTANDEDDEDFMLGEDVVGEVYHALGGTRAVPPLASLLDRGLVLAQPDRQTKADLLRVPRAVRAQLRPLDDLLPLRTKAEAPADESASQPRLDELFLNLASALSSGSIPSRASTDRPSGFHGWEIIGIRSKTRVNPWHPHLDAKEQNLLADHTGLSPEAVGFVIEMMIALGMVEPKKRLTVHLDRLLSYFQRPIVERWFLIGLAWLALDEWSEMALICDTSGPFALWARGPFLHFSIPLTSEAYDFRGFLTRMLARLTSDRWHRLDDLLTLVRQLMEDADVPFFRHVPSPAYGADQQPLWWLAERDNSDVVLDLSALEVLERYYRVLIGALLTGPLAWLGVVEIVEQESEGLSFRVRSGARALLEGEVSDGSSASATGVVSEIVVKEDLSILVPSRTTDAEVYRFLSEIAEFTGISREGLRFRLTADRAQRLFDEGVTGPQLVEDLARRAGRLPTAAQSLLERWWSDYGTVQLYDDLTLIELGDDYLLPELLAASSLKKVLIHTFSPRLIAVESGAVDALRVELERLGHTPKLVEGE